MCVMEGRGKKMEERKAERLRYEAAEWISGDRQTDKWKGVIEIDCVGVGG